MARIISVLLALFLFVFVSYVDAAPLETRQIGNLACNGARLKIVSALAATNKNVKNIDTTDPATADAVSTAQTNLKSAGDGIKTIAKAIITGQQAPADARDQVGNGLLGAQDALNSINGTDPAVTAAQTKLADAISAGQDVVAKCK